MATATAPPQQQSAQQDTPDQHEHTVEEREAYEYWGYLFKADKTGTDKLKSLLKGLKELMNTNYEPSDNPDVTPTQLAYFYRELNGNYDQLFLGTPSESIAFIYKSLGCQHSLQPLSHSTAFTDPTVPALKTEGWIMWQTIQLLLGPEEHSSFLMEAVQKWDVRDPATGAVFPKVLPRQCFPMEPDKHMAAWYEGVSERLRKESEEEERQREIEAQQAEVRRLQYRKPQDMDDDESVDSRGPALAYFRNPLYRHDGRPTIVRPNNGKRPQLSPRRSSMKDKAKEGATTVGHVIRNIGSPNLWDGRGSDKDKGRDRSRDHRRRSLPDNRHHSLGETRPAMDQDSRTSSYNSSGRRRSVQPGRLENATPDEGWNADDEDTPVHSPRTGSRHRPHREDDDPALRHSRSHEPTPSQKEATDYFSNYLGTPDSEGQNITPNGIGPSFAPSASPLFASHVAKQPQPFRPQPNYGPPRDPPPFRRPQSSQPYSRSPAPSSRSRDRDDRHHSRDDRHHSSRSRDGHRHHHSPSRRYDDDVRTSAPNYPPIGGDPRDSRRGSQQSGPPYPPSGPLPNRDRRSMGRESGSELSGYSASDDVRRSGGEDVRRGGPPKQTRFAAGVDGRRYPDGTPWR